MLQVKTQELEERQREMQSAATLLNLEVENEIRTEFKSSCSSSPDPLEDLEASFEGKRSVQCESDSSEPASFTAADRQLLSLEEKFNISRVFLLVKCFGQVAAPGAVLVPVAECDFFFFFSQRMSSGGERRSGRSCSSTRTGSRCHIPAPHIPWAPCKHDLNTLGEWGDPPQPRQIHSVLTRESSKKPGCSKMSNFN